MIYSLVYDNKQLLNITTYVFYLVIMVCYVSSIVVGMFKVITETKRTAEKEHYTEIL